MQINITVLNVTIATVPTAKGGTYQVADVAYKNNTFQGKVEGKKVMSFGATEPAFKVLATAQSGETYDVEYVQTQGKDGKTYNNWVSMQKSNGAVAPQAAAKPAAAAASPRSTYETPEERAAKQVFIVRQSSVSAAIGCLSPGAKAPLKADDVVNLAKQFEAYVLDKKSPGASGFEDFPDVPDEFVKPE